MPDSTKSFRQQVYIHALIHEINISSDIIAKILDIPHEMICDAYAGKVLLDDCQCTRLFKLIAIYCDRSHVH